MDYPDLVRQIGKRYSKLATQTYFPAFTGQYDATALPDLRGNHTITFANTEGVAHLINVYFDNGTYELIGTDGQGFLSLSSTTHQPPSIL